MLLLLLLLSTDRVHGTTAAAGRIMVVFGLFLIFLANLSTSTVRWCRRNDRLLRWLIGSRLRLDTLAPEEVQLLRTPRTPLGALLLFTFLRGARGAPTTSGLLLFLLLLL
uniref:Putative secreted peptide n=1 Tax=Anopheles braziliensis TaxID=58242 RepID=A0A2M3ZQ20_9DIPT